jgi:hypothetical protein
LHLVIQDGAVRRYASGSPRRALGVGQQVPAIAANHGTVQRAICAGAPAGSNVRCPRRSTISDDNTQHRSAPSFPDRENGCN